MTPPSTITARSDSLRPRPAAPALRVYRTRAGVVVVALFAALTGCTAHDYSFACGLVAGFPIGFVFMGWLWAVSRRSV